jgi:6-phospho-beta-glucosidase
MNRPIKVSIIGAGSVYTPELLEMMGKLRDKINIQELRLMDINDERLEIMYGFTDRFLKNINYKLDLKKTIDRIEAVTGVDFIITQIRVGGNAARVFDEKIPLKYGMLGQETTGAGGFAKALRTIPVMIDIAKDVAKYNPSAWIINYTNPTGIVAEAVTKYTNANFVSLCGGGRHPGNMLYRSLGIDHSRVRYDFFGLNHLNFSYNITIDGRPITEKEFEIMAETVPGVNKDMTMALDSIPGLYIPYFFHKKNALEHVAAAERTRGEIVQELEKELFCLYADPSVNTRPELLSKRGGGDYAEMALGVLGAIANNNDTFAVCNVQNNGAIPFLPNDAVVETACMVNAAGVRPITFKSFPDNVWGLICAVKNYETLTVEAAVHGDKVKALLALMAHPLVMDYDIAAPMLDDLLEAHKKYLPQFFKKS